MSGPWEKLTYTNARGESIVFSSASKYHTNFKDVEGMSDVLSTVYTANSVGQDGAGHPDFRPPADDGQAGKAGAPAQTQSDAEPASDSHTHL